MGAGSDPGAVDLGPRQHRQQVADLAPAEALPAPRHQFPKDGGRGLSVAQGGVRRAHVQLQRLHDPGQAGGLAAGQVEHQPGQSRGVHDRMFERLLQAAPHQVGVEGVVAVLDQHRTSCKAQEGRAGVAEARCPHQHRAIDLVPLLGVAVDRRAGFDQGVEEGQRGVQPEALGADLDDQERPVAGGLHVERDILGLAERSFGRDRHALREQLRKERDLTEARLEPDPQYAFLWLQTRNRVISRILRSNARLQFSM